MANKPFQPYEKNHWGNYREGNYTQIDSTGDINQYGTATANLGNTTISGTLAATGKLTVAEAEIGDVSGGDYVDIDTAGHTRLIGGATCFLDEFGPLIGQRLESPGSNITQNNAEGSLTFDNSCDLADYVTMSVQLNHDRKEGADVIPHLHWWQTTSAMPNWMIRYRWQRNGQAKVSGFTNAIWTSNAFTYTSGTLNQITSFGAITPPSGDGVSTILQIRLIRDTGNASTLFSGAEVGLGSMDAVFLDTHKEVDSYGSNTEYTK